ncbi:MAG TPA: hypothetical protein VJZ76_05200 [Thermoanaerobaculia bacterium]|nr:hypothetical protein [Thermoanaerobaculia bacterium]
MPKAISLALLAVILSARLAGAADTTVVWFTAELPYFSNREAQTPFVVTAKNRNDETMTGYRGTVTFSASLRGADPSVELPPDYTFTAADAGTHTFYVVFHRGGQHQVWVTDVANADLSGSDDTSVQCPELTLTATNSGPVCPGSTITLTAQTNAPNPSFTWYPHTGGGGLVLHGQTVTTTMGGTWFVTMDDTTAGCSATATTSVAYEPIPQVSVPSTASGDYAASIAGDSNGPYTNIVWSVRSGGSVIAGQGTATATIRPNPSAAAVVVTVDATRVSTGCRQGNEGTTDIVAAPPDARISTGGSVCPNGSGVASVPDAGAGAAYAWSLQNASLVSGQGTPSIVFTASASGAISIAATVTRGGATATGHASVAVDSPSAALRAGPTAAVCAGDAAILDVALTGTPPFTLVWSDGMTQSGIMSNAVSRQVSPAETTIYSIAAVSDAACSGNAGGGIRIDVLAAPHIARSPQSAAVSANTAARLTVDAPGDALMFQWFEGERGDVSKPVGGSAAVFVTPPVTKATSYWVRVSSACGSSDSAAAVVAPARVRAARH